MTIDVKIIQKETIADRIVQLVLARPNGRDLPPFEPGAHVDVHIDQSTVRQYSLVPSGSAAHYAIAVLDDPNGRGGSSKVHRNLQVGDGVQISEPRNQFPLEEAEHSILIAGGIGITPILAMADSLSRQRRSFELHYCCRAQRNAAFYTVIRQSPWAANTRFYFDEEGQQFDPSVLANASEHTRMYVCGPEGFIQYVRDNAARLGWPEHRVHYELFQKSVADGTGHGQRFQLHIDGTDQVIDVEASETALEALSRSGIDVPCSCEQGICGTCVLAVVEGLPDHQDMFLTDSEKQANNQFTPCCSRALTPVLTIKCDT